MHILDFLLIFQIKRVLFVVYFKKKHQLFVIFFTNSYPSYLKASGIIKSYSLG